MDKTQSVSKGLETILTKHTTGKGASSIARNVKEDEASRTIKLEDLVKLMSSVQPSFKDLDSPDDDPIIVVDDSDEDEEADEVYATINVETEDTSVLKSSSPSSSQIQELTNQVLILQSQKHKLELDKNKAEAEATLLKAQPLFPNILSAHDFSSSLPTELKDLPSKFNELTKEVKGLTSQVAELKTLRWEPPAEFISLPVQVASVQAKLKTLYALPGLSLHITKALNKFTQVLNYASSKAGDQSVPLAGQANTMPTKGEKNTNQATISQLFQRRAKKNAEKENLNNQQPKPVPSIITTTTQMQSPIQSPPKSSSQLEGEHINKDKGKKAMSSEEAEKESTNSGSNNDDETHVTGSVVKSSTTKKLKKFDFITEDGKHIHLTEEQINQQKKIEEKTKAEAAKNEGEVRKAELVDLLSPEVGPVTLKVYKEDGTSEVILNFKASDLHLGEWREVVKACPNRTRKGWKTIYGQIQTRIDYLHTIEAELGINLDIPLSEQDPLDKLNDLANKKRKHADDIHDYCKANKRLKSSVQYENHLPDLKYFSNTMLYTVQEIFFRRHQGPRLDDQARTFSSIMLAEVDKRNLNPLKQTRVIEKLRQ
ncbi:hypothetical protein Tco_0839687 [Tanacetum coccineum]|uniref:Uncharacterized protein n=1 Tax=Tanacetum coccineum TaxID=301880 RepID=A0ABQ5ARC2_9ASTR